MKRYFVVSESLLIVFFFVQVSPLRAEPLSGEKPSFPLMSLRRAWLRKLEEEGKGRGGNHPSNAPRRKRGCFSIEGFLKPTV